MRDAISPIEQDLRVDLAAAYRLAAHYGWDDGIGTHFSLRIPGPEHHFLMLPLGAMYEEVTASTLVKVDVAGDLVGGRDGGRVNKAGFTIHSAIHQAVPDANCVFHCHTVPGIAIGAQREGLLPLSFHSMFVYGQVGYHDAEGVTVVEDEMPRMLQALGNGKALMLRNHGTLVAAPSVAEAFFLLFHLEKACAIQVAAQAGGKELSLLSEAMAEHIRAQVATNFATLADMMWAAMRRKADRLDSGYRV